MARGGKAEWKQGRKTQFRVGDKGSDDSDEDYVVEEDELSNEDNEEEDLGDYCSDDNIDDVEGLEEEEDFDSYEDEEEEVKKKPSRPKRTSASTQKKTGAKTSRRKKRITYQEREEDDCDFDDEDDDEDEEFTPEEFDCLEEEEESVVTKSKRKDRKVTETAFRRKPLGQTRKRKRSSKVVKRNVVAKKVRKPIGFRRKPRDDSEDDFNITDEEPVASERSNKNVARRRKLIVQSDSDFVSSESSDEDFTISEEEREQVREASKFCRDLVIPSRSSCSLKKVEVKANLCPQKKPPGRKGKEKIEEIKNEVGNAKQVCGICLSEEGKRTTRGTLNCCSHYFCFACILEWSKVESRCPLCKQRFMTISKPSKPNAGIDLKDVISIPERDQVYQPSEEEIRGYLDPYENVICTECHEGGDDDLMLLCDLCDSPAHTYCVGLGREVPEGNWYCKDCRSDALASLNAQAQDSGLEQRATSNSSSHRLSPFDNFGDDLDGLMSVPPTPFTQGNGIFPSPRYFGGDVQAPSPRSGVGVLTLSGRRRIHRQIQSILSNNNRLRQASSITDNISAFRSGYNNVQNINNHTWEGPVQHTPEAGTSYIAFLGEGLRENPSLFNVNVNPFPGRLNNIRQQVVQEPTSTSHNCGHGTLCSSDNLMSQGAHLRQSNSVAGVVIDNNILHDHGLPHVGIGEGSYLVGEKEQVGSMVETFLTGMSRDIGLVSVDADNTIFKDVAWSSTQTVLAACGLEHVGSEVYPMQPPSLCSHIEATSVAHTSLMKGQCISCFNNFVREVVKTIMNSRLPHFLQLRD